MKRQYISYGIIGIVAGLVLGFLVGNWTTSKAGSQVVEEGRPKSESVNSGTQTSAPQLPEGHPPIKPGETIPAGPLPEGAMPPNDAIHGGATAPSDDVHAGASQAQSGAQSGKNVELKPGIERKDVIAKFGEPDRTISAGSKEILIYSALKLKVTLVKGKVTDIE
ncbi:MAG TPA: hypothetical protein VNN73_20555 [Blastocatellia bacterium]|nr:hypothetical protein [Blastocatellia bacterium]